ncbi:uncharacterized protein BXZ73DRAFT_52374 [Epithele typhae]|uniref:uncharacterized protein n=1 Tax=Epithele typhae TaxID=378194 RepID=UPI002007CE97|nr:uncharacterized protein BXZ73DRAFT_52374 [Epithele typhae]KAH9920011.1 hypothetical protein BXZ73DRAFT_52374 [Epithele typhae]
MLVLHPDSQCDVCLESYHGHREPLVITCGHIFCQSCLAMLPRRLCPLCRVPFDVEDIRKLHADKTAVPPSPPLAPADLDPDASQARHLQTALTGLILEGASGMETAELMNSIRSWLLTQSPDEVRAHSRFRPRLSAGACAIGF